MILAVLQARVSSTRLPGKVIKPILGMPMLMRQVERVNRARLIDRLIIATSSDVSDDPIEKLCVENSLDCYRGKLEDVLDRFYQAARPIKPDHIVRLTGDCPLADPEVIDRVIGFYLENSFDYAGNALEPTYPDGLDVEVFSFSCLQEAWEEALLPSQREHVTTFIYQQQDRYKIGSFKNDIDLSGLRWTVDEHLDFELVSIIYAALYPLKPEFTMRDILAFLDEKPELKSHNTCFHRNEGYQKSLLKDTIFVKSHAWKG